MPWQAPPGALCPRGETAGPDDTLVRLRSNHPGPGLRDTFSYVDCSRTHEFAVGQTVTVLRRALVERDVRIGEKGSWWTLPLPGLVFGSVAVAGTFAFACVKRRLPADWGQRVSRLRRRGS